MKLHEDVVIPQDKLLRYLLVFREKSDKSGFLALAGYTRDNWEVLERDLRQLVKNYEVSATEPSPHGIKYIIRGTLTGPNGRSLNVTTVWIKNLMGETSFVTLVPEQE